MVSFGAALIFDIAVFVGILAGCFFVIHRESKLEK